MRLFYGECPFPSVESENASEAAALVRNGNTVCVPSRDVAWHTLQILGLSHEDATRQLDMLA
jgi:hypothetical protein